VPLNRRNVDRPEPRRKGLRAKIPPSPPVELSRFRSGRSFHRLGAFSSIETGRARAVPPRAPHGAPGEPSPYRLGRRTTSASTSTPARPPSIVQGLGAHEGLRPVPRSLRDCSPGAWSGNHAPPGALPGGGWATIRPPVIERSRCAEPKAYSCLSECSVGRVDF